MSLDEDKRDALFAWWISYLGRVTGPVRKTRMEELLGEISELSQAWMKTTDTQLRTDGVLKFMLKKWGKKPGLSGGDDID